MLNKLNEQLTRDLHAQKLGQVMDVVCGEGCGRVSDGVDMVQWYGGMRGVW